MQIRLVSGDQDFCIVEHGHIGPILGGELSIKVHPDDTALFMRCLELKPIDAWRFHAIMSAHGLKSALENILFAMPEPDQAKARARLEYSLTYNRFDPLVDQLGAALNLTSDEIDGLWREAAAL